MIEIVAVKLDKVLEKRKFDRLASYITTEKRERINRFYRYEDAQRTLIGDILMRFLLCKKLQVKNQNLVFEINKYGKPFLLNCNDIHFNISHSGKWVVGCIDNYPIGIDVEQIKLIDMSIAERFLSKEEVKILMWKNIVDREAYFYDLWTLKESYIKAIGKGLSIPLDSFTIKIDGNITVCSTNESDNYYFKQYCIDNIYKTAVCSSKKNFPSGIKLIDIDELYEDALLL